MVGRGGGSGRYCDGRYCDGRYCDGRRGDERMRSPTGTAATRPGRARVHGGPAEVVRRGLLGGAIRFHLLRRH